MMLTKEEIRDAEEVEAVHRIPLIKEMDLTHDQMLREAFKQGSVWGITTGYIDGKGSVCLPQKS